MKHTREKVGWEVAPSFGITELPSVKAAGWAENNGIDREKAKGWKVENVRIVDYVTGNLLSVVAHVANIYDTKFGIFAVKKGAGLNLVKEDK